MEVNLHAPTSSRTTTNKRLLGALGIPDLMPPIRQKVRKDKGK